MVLASMEESKESAGDARTHLYVRVDVFLILDIFLDRAGAIAKASRLRTSVDVDNNPDICIRSIHREGRTPRRNLRNSSRNREHADGVK